MASDFVTGPNRLKGSWARRGAKSRLFSTRAAITAVSMCPRWRRAGVLASVAIALYVVTMLAHTRWVFVAAGAGMVVAATLFAVNLLHEVAHGQFVRSPRLRRLLLRLGFLPIGLDGDIWVARHVRLHHAGEGRSRPFQRRVSRSSDLGLLCDLYGVVDFDP